ncbi:MAG: hypothetical protein PHY54_07140 [Methylococcales bacterium]|nr:hypothetical protein [Methylococcales bacterium]
MNKILKAQSATVLLRYGMANAKPSAQAWAQQSELLKALVVSFFEGENS